MLGHHDGERAVVGIEVGQLDRLAGERVEDAHGQRARQRGQRRDVPPAAVRERLRGELGDAQAEPVRERAQQRPATRRGRAADDERGGPRRRRARPAGARAARAAPGRRSAAPGRAARAGATTAGPDRRRAPAARRPARAAACGRARGRPGRPRRARPRASSSRTSRPLSPPVIAASSAAVGRRRPGSSWRPANRSPKRGSSSLRAATHSRSTPSAPTSSPQPGQRQVAGRALLEAPHARAPGVAVARLGHRVELVPVRGQVAARVGRRAQDAAQGDQRPVDAEPMVLGGSRRPGLEDAHR